MQDLNNRRVPMDELCEIASELTVITCKYAGITNINKEDESNGLEYTDKAQDIFNDTLDVLDYQLNDK